MSPNGSRFPEYRIPDVPPDAAFYELLAERARPRHRYWLHILLFLLTIVTTSVVGAGLAEAFAAGRPFRADDVIRYDLAWQNPAYLLNGLAFSLTLMGVLLAHEMGHFLTARHYRVDASLPYFLPAPLLIGTLGAFIKIRSAILRKRVLFDVGVGGPVAGFVALLIPLAAGVAMSKVISRVAESGDVVFGTPLLLRALEWAIFPGVPVSDIHLHPMARGAWVGLLATSLNLLPIGQLDGGHILYCFLGDRMKYVSWVLVTAFLPMGYFFAPSWFFWAAVLATLGMKHPQLVDPTPMDPARTRLAWFSLFMLVVCFTPSPIT